jgi:hypothetical protein
VHTYLSLCLCVSHLWISVYSWKRYVIGCVSQWLCPMWSQSAPRGSACISNL